MSPYGVRFKAISFAFAVEKPDGYLFLGAAEMPMSVDNSFERVNLTRAGCYKLK